MGIATNHNGYITSARVTAADIPRRKLTEAVRGELVQVDRGLYASPSAWEDPLCIANHRFSCGIFSDDTALFLHGMTDRAPFSPTMTPQKLQRDYDQSSRHRMPHLRRRRPKPRPLRYRSRPWHA